MHLKLHPVTGPGFRIFIKDSLFLERKKWENWLQKHLSTAQLGRPVDLGIFSLSEVFGRIIFNNKGSRNVFFFLIR